MATRDNRTLLAGIRPARLEDQPTIRRIVRRAGINPLGLPWQRFVLAEVDGRIVGTGQIKPHKDESRELASLAVVPAFQGQGIGGDIIRHLLAAEQGPVYLMCAGRLGGYYARFGFRVIEPAEMPPYFRRVHHLANVLATGEPRLLVMVWHPASRVLSTA